MAYRHRLNVGLSTFNRRAAGFAQRPTGLAERQAIARIGQQGSSGTGPSLRKARRKERNGYTRKWLGVAASAFPMATSADADIERGRSALLVATVPFVAPSPLAMAGCERLEAVSVGLAVDDGGNARRACGSNVIASNMHDRVAD